MLNPQIARHVLHTVNLQINSNYIFINKPTPSFFDFPARFNLYKQTHKSIKELSKKFPTQRLTERMNLLSQIALLYSQLRVAVADRDEPLLHRYLTNGLYQQYKQMKQEGKQRFKLYPIIYNMQVRQAQLYENQNGKWIQCLVRTIHEKNQQKQHIVERKLANVGGGVRTWYFVKFQN